MASMHRGISGSNRNDRTEYFGQELRLWLNLFLPSVKLEKKARVGSKVRRVDTDLNASVGR